MKVKRFLSIMLVVIAIISFGIMYMNYGVDSMQFYRKASKYNIFLSMQQRYQVPGLAKNFNYDSIVVGTSMTENFLPSYIDNKLGWNVMKLSIEGSSIREQTSTAQLAIRQGHVKNILWELNYSSLGYKYDEVHAEFPKFMYDENPLNDIQYLLNLDTLQNSYNIMKSKNVATEQEKEQNLEMLNNWDSGASYGKDVTLEDYKKGLFPETYYETDKITNMKQNVDKNILKVVKDNPNINFMFYYPPFSILRHEQVYLTNKKEFYNEIEIEKYIFEKLGSFKNVKIYSFEADKKITFNLDNYKDITHHSGVINNYIIDCIKDDSHVVNSGNLDTNLKELENQVVNYQP